MAQRRVKMVILGGGNWVKGDNVKDGDKFTFLDTGAWVESQKYTYKDSGKPKVDCIIGVKLNDEEGT